MYQLIKVSGLDTDSFLQGQLTQDVRLLGPEKVLRSAWCNPKGRVVASMTMMRSDDDIDLLLPENIAGQFLQRISIYKMRARLELALARNWHCLAVQSEQDLRCLETMDLMPTTPGAYCRADPLSSVCVASDPLIVEVFGDARAMQALMLQQALNRDQWCSALIRNGMVMIDAETTEKYTPHMLSLELAGAVSFDKGCYPGQEVVARTEHLGRSRRRLAHYQCDASGHAAGDPLLDSEQNVGTVVNASGSSVLAVTSVDSQHKTLLLNGAAAHPAKLPWQS